MPKVERHDIDSLNLSLTVTLEKSEVKKQFNSELNKFRQKASIKGFRPGKTPEMVIKRMYGESIFGEIIQNLLNGSISKFMEEEPRNYLGQPIPSEDTPSNKGVSTNKIEDMVFKFDMGYVDNIEPKGADITDTYTKYIPEVPEKWVDDALLSDRQRLGERLAVQDLIQEKDVVKVSAKEVNGTHTSNFSVLVEMLTDDAQDVFKQHKQGDSFQMSIYHLEKGASEAKVRKYFLLLEDDDNTEVSEMFHLTIDEVTRVTLAEFTEDYFTKSYGGAANSEEEAKAFIKKEYESHFEHDSFGLMVGEMQRELTAKNTEIQLPDTFLKRWLLLANPNNTEELIEKEYDAFTKNLRWDLTRDFLRVKFDIQTTEADILEIFRDKTRQMYSGQFGADIVDMLAGHVMEEARTKNKKDYEEAVNTANFIKFFTVVSEKVTIDKQYVSIDEFNKIREEAMSRASIERENDQMTTLEKNVEEAEYEEI